MLAPAINLPHSPRQCSEKGKANLAKPPRSRSALAAAKEAAKDRAMSMDDV